MKKQNKENGKKYYCPVCSQELKPQTGFNGAVAFYLFCDKGHFNNLEGILYESWWYQIFSCKCEIYCGRFNTCPKHPNSKLLYINKPTKGS